MNAISVEAVEAIKEAEHKAQQFRDEIKKKQLRRLNTKRKPIKEVWITKDYTVMP